MLMEPSISIVIPAYKRQSLHRTLGSIAAQDDMDFALYVGDDCSPEDIESVVKEYGDRLNVRYVRFGQNLGGTDLLAHWERCIDLVEEDYILFFSDDDILPPDAVSRARKCILKYPDNEFFRFRLEVIDGDDNPIHANPEFTSDISSAEEMLCDKLAGRISSAAVEYVFSRRLYESVGGHFVHFPVAWCSDDATWYLMAKENGVVNIRGNAVGWRNVTDGNISNSSRYNREKMQALVMFMDWLKDNWGGKVDGSFISSLKTYVRTVLYISLDGDFSHDDSRRLFRALKNFSHGLALYIYVKMNITIFRRNL